MSTQINPLHRSMRLQRRAPRGMSAITLDKESREFLEREALEVFAAMTNQGHPLQSVLAAVFLSGMAAARQSMRDSDTDRAGSAE